MKCVACGATMKTVRENHNYKESGLPGVTLVDLEVSRCEACGEREVKIPAIEQLHSLIARSIVLKPARLVPEEVRFLRKHLGLSQADLSARFGVTVETISRWENGKVPLSEMADRFLRFWAATREPITCYENEMDKVAVRKAERSKLRLRRNHETWRAVKAA
jgi:putative transcriptional regulator